MFAIVLSFIAGAALTVIVMLALSVSVDGLGELESDEEDE